MALAGLALGLLPAVSSGSGWVPDGGQGRGLRGEQEGGESEGSGKDRVFTN